MQYVQINQFVPKLSTTLNTTLQHLFSLLCASYECEHPYELTRNRYLPDFLLETLLYTRIPLNFFKTQKFQYVWVAKLDLKLPDTSVFNNFIGNPSFIPKNTRTRMETPVALNVPPVNVAHKDLDYLSLVDKEFQIKDLEHDNCPIKLYCWCWDDYINNSDTIGLWESNLPKYIFHSVHIFLDIIHQCQDNYNPNLRVVMSPN